jgi:alkylated DNA repair dioxygenase AlkB
MNANKEFRIIEDFYDATESDHIYRLLLQEQNWPDNSYSVAGRLFELPRLQTWHADPGISYSYSNNLLQTQPWTPLLADIRQKVELFLSFSFNAVLVNLYRNGQDYVGWHADNEADLGEQPYIASLTLGATRQFAFRQKKTAECGSVLLRSGTLLTMQPAFQHHWLHSIPAEPHVTQGRINLTFRKVIVRQ